LIEDVEEKQIPYGNDSKKSKGKVKANAGREGLTSRCRYRNKAV